MTTVALACAVIGAALPSAASAATAEATRCGNEAGTGKRVCVASSEAYPQVKGWYGYTWPTSPCNSGPFEGYWPSGVVGVCMVSYVDAWSWTGSTWKKTSVSEGAKGYVHPFTSDWRWLYIKDSKAPGWVAIKASSLGLRWYA